MHLPEQAHAISWLTSRNGTNPVNLTGNSRSQGNEYGWPAGKGIDLRQENTKKLFGYWNRIRDGRIAPERGEIEPSDIRDVLADTFILEISARLRTISFRLAGTRLCAAHGRELKSYGFLGLWAEEDNFEIAKAVSRVYCEFKPVLINSIARTGSNQFMEFETLLLPLQTPGEDNSRVLGVSTPKSVPYWLGSEPIEYHSCRGMRVIELPHETATLVPALGDLGGDLAAAGEEDRKIRPRKVAHLTIFQGGRE